MDRPLMAGIAIMTGFVILLTESRGAILSIAIVMGGTIFCLAGFSLARRIHLPVWSVLFIMTLPLVMIVAWVRLHSPGELTSMLDGFFGLASVSDRVTIARNTWQLIGDFPFTGGGLCFPGSLLPIYPSDPLLLPGLQP